MTPPTKTQISEAKAEVMFDLWKSRNPLSWFDVIEVESEFHFPLLNTETGAASRSFVEAGKKDGLLRSKKTGRFFVLENKTTSDPIDAGSVWWRALAMNSQPAKYILDLMHKGVDVAGIVYNVIKRPAHRPSEKKEEPLDAFQVRLVEDVMTRPGEFFDLKEVGRTDLDIVEYMEDAWAAGQQLLEYRRRGLWPRNPDACLSYGTCEYFDLCSRRASINGIDFAQGGKVHRELELQEADGKELLTNSRSRALRKCARYHKLKYEDGVSKTGEESEALSFGTAMHRMIEAHLKTMIVKL